MNLAAWNIKISELTSGIVNVSHIVFDSLDGVSAHPSPLHTKDDTGTGRNIYVYIYIYIYIKAVGLEWGPLSLVSTTEELLDRKVAAPV
jgi:hypothetical protein